MAITSRCPASPQGGGAFAQRGTWSSAMSITTIVVFCIVVIVLAGMLPKTVVPIPYKIDLKPNLTKLTVTGDEVVDIEVREPTDRLVLNARDMSFASATVDGVGPASKIAFDDDEQTVTLTFRRPLGVGRRVLRIAFAAQIHKNGRGIYYADYETADGRKRMMATHSEPTDARRIFPGWDEPAFKGTFDLSVTVPQEFLAGSY